MVRCAVAAVLFVSSMASMRCPLLDCKSVPPAQHIKDVGPCDIKTVMAMGDSITAAAVPYPPRDGIFEYRELSFSIGGGVGYTTIPNILTTVTNQRPVGPSTSYHFIEMRGHKHDYPEDHGSAAQSGAFISDLVGGSGNQTAYLEQWIAANNISSSDWKLLTIFIGANDICNACRDRTTPQQFETALKELLTMLRRLLSRVFINLLPIFEVSQVYKIADPSEYCRLLHDVVVECPCLYHYGEEGRQSMDNLTDVYNNITMTTAAAWRGKYDDFAVVAQPYLIDFQIPSLSYVSMTDCFHPAPVAHAALATALWNQMFQSVGSKVYPGNVSETLYCPTAQSRFAS